MKVRSSLNMRHNHQKTQTNGSLPPICWLLISVQVLLTAGEEAVHSTLPAGARRVIGVEVTKGGRNREIRSGLSYTQWDSDVWRSQWQNREKSERCQSLEHSQQCLQVMYGDTGCRVPLSYLGYAGLSRTADLSYCHWCITKHICCKGLWVIGFWFFSWLKPTTCLLYTSASRRLRDREKWNLYIYWLYSYSSMFCYSKCLTFVTKII